MPASPATARRSDESRQAQKGETVRDVPSGEPQGSLPFLGIRIPAQVKGSCGSRPPCSELNILAGRLGICSCDVPHAAVNAEGAGQRKKAFPRHPLHGVAFLFSFPSGSLGGFPPWCGGCTAVTRSFMMGTRRSVCSSCSNLFLHLSTGLGGASPTFPFARKGMSCHHCEPRSGRGRGGFSHVGHARVEPNE